MRPTNDPTTAANHQSTQCAGMSPRLWIHLRWHTNRGNEGTLDQWLLNPSYATVTNGMTTAAHFTNPRFLFTSLPSALPSDPKPYYDDRRSLLWRPESCCWKWSMSPILAHTRETGYHGSTQCAYRRDWEQGHWNREYHRWMSSGSIGGGDLKQKNLSTMDTTTKQAKLRCVKI